MGVVGGGDDLGKRGDRPGRARDHQEPGSDGRRRAQPAQPPGLAQIRAESLHGGPEAVPDPEDGGLKPPRRRDEGADHAGQVGRPPGCLADGGPDGDLGADPVQPVGGGLHRVGRHPQRMPQRLLKAGLAGIGAAVAHPSRSSTERSAAIARELWLLTAPLVIPIAVAICASERSP
jgi:hypothetical protein